MAELQTVVNVKVLVPREGPGTPIVIIPDIPDIPDVPDPTPETFYFVLRNGDRLVDRNGDPIKWRETSKHLILRDGGRLVDRNGNAFRYR